MDEQGKGKVKGSMRNLRYSEREKEKGEGKTCRI